MGEKNARQKFREKYKYIPLNKQMPEKYDARKREELRNFEKSIIGASNNNIGKEPGE